MKTTHYVVQVKELEGDWIDYAIRRTKKVTLADAQAGIRGLAGRELRVVERTFQDRVIWPEDQAEPVVMRCGYVFECPACGETKEIADAPAPLIGTRCDKCQKFISHEFGTPVLGG